jgi:hypothetical protein
VTKDAFTAAYEADMWRVDVAGYPVFVKGQVARAHLEKVNQQLARMRLALHKIKGGHSQDHQLDATRALRDD